MGYDRKYMFIVSCGKSLKNSCNFVSPVHTTRHTTKAQKVVADLVS